MTCSETESWKSIIQQHLELNALDVDIYQTDWRISSPKIFR